MLQRNNVTWNTMISGQQLQLHRDIVPRAFSVAGFSSVSRFYIKSKKTLIGTHSDANGEEPFVNQGAVFSPHSYVFDTGSTFQGLSKCNLYIFELMRVNLNPCEASCNK